eukprot:TRINITY_DN3848_c0_g1_i20.p3 TRINITY_DN3848_c0_g1~~TRINITY_DN3848_c0_g1_i20.p3  ORF type:complete len:126 (+),score=55.61 TRINITY_DN3848_c0_g1_i20:107-484(+)
MVEDFGNGGGIFSGLGDDSALADRRQKEEMARASALRAKADEEADKKRERIAKSKAKFQEALEERRKEIDRVKRKHREEEKKKQEVDKKANPWAKIKNLVDFSMNGTKDVSRMRDCLKNKIESSE